jgi:nucleoside-diphosphate-sugar epimerase
MKKVLITGGAGYLGSILTELLLSKGYKVDVLDNLSLRQTSLFHLCHNENFNLIQADVTNSEYLTSIVPEYDIIIPLAAIVGAPACDANKDLST